MEAEFAKALSAQLKAPFTRVLVALLEAVALVPELLIGCPVFVTSDGGANTLAQFVKCGNQSDFIPDETEKLFNEQFLAGCRMPRRIKSPSADVSCVEGLLGLPWRIAAPGSEEFDWYLLSFRNWLERAERSDLNSVPGLVSMLLSACFDAALSKNIDNRANAVGAMTRLAQLGYQGTESQLLFLLSREQNAGVASVSFPWMEKHFHSLTRLNQDIALLAIAKAPIEAAACFGSAFVASLPESVQCRLRTGRDLDFNTLSRKERLQLATRRIDILLKDLHLTSIILVFEKRSRACAKPPLLFSWMKTTRRRPVLSLFQMPTT